MLDPPLPIQILYSPGNCILVLHFLLFERLQPANSVDSSDESIPVYHIMAATVGAREGLQRRYLKLGHFSEVLCNICRAVVTTIAQFNLLPGNFLLLQRQHSIIPTQQELPNMLWHRLVA